MENWYTNLVLRVWGGAVARAGSVVTPSLERSPL